MSDGPEGDNGGFAQALDDDRHAPLAEKATTERLRIEAELEPIVGVIVER
ncbi:hypothetical protein [Actinoplanes sp. NPDC051851]